MNNVTMKTYKDSYLYNNKVSKAADNSDVKSTNNALIEFIKTCHRIEVNEDSFRGVLDDIKFQNSGSLLYAIAIDPRVKICIANTELPRAFKVLDAYDIKNNKQPTVFIDATGIIEYKNGRYFCRKIDTLCAYLFDAMIYLIYRYSPSRFSANAAVLASATECYVSMFSYIIDYMRIIGYSVNKNKINFLAGMFFLVNMVGLDLNAAKNIAAKVADVNPRDLNAYSLYFDDVNMFTNIASFIQTISNLFNLKGFTLEVFVSKWIYLFGTGTHYATELFTSFLVLMCNACSGSYIVNQRTVQKCCGKNNSSPMIKLYLAIKKAGVDTFDLKGITMEAKNIREEVASATSKSTRELKEHLELKNIEEADMILKAKNFKNKDINDIKEECNEVRSQLVKMGLPKRSNRVAEASINNIIEYATSNAINFINNEDATYIDSTLITVAESFKNMLDTDQMLGINRKTKDAIAKINEAKEDSENKEGITKANKIQIELRDMMLHL